MHSRAVSSVNKEPYQTGVLAMTNIRSMSPAASGTPSLQLFHCGMLPDLACQACTSLLAPQGEQVGVLVEVRMFLQERLLEKITAANLRHVVRLVTSGSVGVDDMDFRALVLRPVGEPVQAGASTSLVAQVAPQHAPWPCACLSRPCSSASAAGAQAQLAGSQSRRATLAHCDVGAYQLHACHHPLAAACMPDM